MKRLIIAGLLVCTNTLAQKYNTEHTSAVFRDADRSGRRVPVEIYYPGSITGQESGSAATDHKFPVIVFAHGYLLSGNSYRHISDMLVPEGFIIVFLSSADGLFPSHRSYGRDVRFVADHIRKMGPGAPSSVYSMCSDKICLMGHSMGGGAVFLAAAQNDNIDAVVVLSPYDTRPSAISAAAEVKVPTLIFSGTNDCITPPDQYHYPMYINSASTEKTYILIKGGTHCQMGVSYEKCTIGERMARCTPGISEQEQLSIISRYLVPWLRFFVKGESDQGSCFNESLLSDEAVTWKQSRPLSAAIEETK